ncbi:MAG TPA: outer membrane beta-barrel protein [Terriglobales bacterium]|nr:outer membrane beta-barrel protein [Terriglobales bacterium]
MFAKLSLMMIVVLSLVMAVAAQEKTSDLSLNVSGLVTQESQNNGVLQTASNAGGGLATFRHHFTPRVAFDLNYGLSKNTQYYTVTAAATEPAFYGVQSYANEATGDLLLSVYHHGRLHPFLLAGGGAVVFDPTGFSFGTSSQERQTRAAFLYGGGTDVGLAHNFALRLQYRGLIYRAPDFGVSTLSTGMFTHTAEPSAGLVYRFSLPHLVW